MRPPDGTTQFVDLLLDGKADEVEYSYFSWRAALFGDYDVLHIHWPELMFRDSRSRLRAFVKRRLVDLLVARLDVKKIPIVRTYHNPRPHERGKSAELRTLDKIDHHTTLFIALNEHTRPDAHRACTVIPHGHYVEPFARLPQVDPVGGRLVYFGIIRPYKNVETLVRVFRSLEADDMTLHVVGNPHAGQREPLAQAAQDDPRITQILRFVDDDEMVREVREASLVVLPYREMRNSGALLVAMSLRRPALVPSSEVNRMLADEFGHDWVRMYDGELTAEALSRHLREVEGSGLLATSGPDLRARDGENVGRRHLDAYRMAIAAVERGPSALVTAT
ncbi:glycosyltransferase [Microbacterium sp. NPDC064584]|uniref:glycosyltransferase n=1 Tax=Microbacterium sp. NPDC064584 TaxID=3155817 RepID=UPI0034244F2F